MWEIQELGEGEAQRGHATRSLWMVSILIVLTQDLVVLVQSASNSSVHMCRLVLCLMFYLLSSGVTQSLLS
ncbi:uncharacterized protein CC84DRAFT_827406 [Paraphaeosphaeria sporulosa]|uniref:Uncharacterized protein n=1 Tax=Paraphaeosphaeria sporulosa TaxID=1460663 RepID=A0A177CEA6_9PLEO|nr:uncharacterized protein CC84DRAFT_827406 [Paraphaeosphaeria sporulosa]OAG05097.1 hypothetical protein CC84DRAFT_827406 [Paraphaeosphaeria sporulosa]